MSEPICDVDQINMREFRRKFVRCGHCVFFKNNRCFRHPPAISYDQELGEPMFNRPKVSDWDFCGDGYSWEWADEDSDERLARRSPKGDDVDRAVQ